MLATQVLQRLPSRLWRHKTVLLGLLLLPLGAAVLLVGALGRPALTGNAGQPFPAVATDSASGAPTLAEQNMRALRDGNAQLFWESLADETKQRLRSQGIGSPEDLQQLFARSRAAGEVIVGYLFVARYDTKTGDTVSFFVAQRKTASGEQLEIPYLITTNRQGYVINIE